MFRFRTLFVLLAVFALAVPVARAADDVGKDKAKVGSDPKDDEYYELLKVFIDTMDQVERNYVDKVDRRELLESAIRGVLGKLDPYSNYISPDDMKRFRDNVDSEFGGVGIQISVQNGLLKIISPLVGSPAYRAGIEADDVITEIEGKPTEGITIDGAVRQLKGKPGTTVNIKVRAARDGKVRDVKLAREIVHIDTVLGDSRKDDDSWQYMYDEKLKIGYIRMTAFSRDTASELKKALKELTKDEVKGLVVDLRFNPGGLLSSAIEICDMFIPEGKIVSTKGRNTEERSWEAHRAGTFEGFPMAILVNRYSASASEIMSACLQDHKRAIVIGERTWGKGSVQNVIELEGGKSALKLTTASYWRPSGKNIHRFPDAKEWGVDPNDGFEVKVDGKELRDLVSYRRDRDILRRHKGEDEGEEPKQAEPEEKVDDNFVDRQLQKALEYLKEEVSKGKEKAA